MTPLRELPSASSVVVWLIFALSTASITAQDNEPVRRASTSHQGAIEDDKQIAARLKSAGIFARAEPSGVWVIIRKNVSDSVFDDLERLRHLRSLYLIGPWVTDEQMKRVGSLSTLEDVFLEAPNVGDAGVAQIARLTALTNLTVRGIKLTDNGLSPLAGLSKLHTLMILECKQFTGAGLVHLQNLKELQELHLEGNNLRDAELTHTAMLPALKTLELHDPHITDAAVDHLKALKGIQSLRLHRTQITDDGVDALQQALPKVEIIGGSLAAGQDNLKKIGFAIHQYHSEKGHFPPAVLTGPDGKTTYSWRVELLPWLGEEALFKQYRQDQPWDSEANRKVLLAMPDVFKAPQAAAVTNQTAYFAVTGPKTVFPGRKGVLISEIDNGTTGVILIVEAQRDIPWTKPEDIAYDPDGDFPDFGGFHARGFNALMGDGNPRFIEFPPREDDQLRAMLSKSWRPDQRAKSRAKLIGKPAPDFTLHDLAGEQVTLSKVCSGKVALLVFSPVEIARFRKASPHLTRLIEKHQSDGLVVIAVNPTNEPPDVVRKYIENKKIAHHILHNGFGVAQEKYFFDAWPAFCWIDHTGVVVDVKIGFQSGDEDGLAKRAAQLIEAKRNDAANSG